MKTVIRSALAVALMGAVLGLTQTARAEEKKAEHQKMTGEIKAVDAKAGTITLAHRTGEVTFTAAPDIKFGHAGEKVQMTLADLKVGDKVVIHYSEDAGKKIAHKVAHVENEPKKETKK